LAELREVLTKEEKTVLVKAVTPCLQCGICTSSCPPARFTDPKLYFSPRLLASEILKDNLDYLAKSETIWRCFLCFECVNLCPHSVPLPDIILRLREYALTKGLSKKIYDVLQGPIENLIKTGAIFPFGRINLRKFIGLPSTTELPEESLKKLKRIFEETGFKSFVDKLKLTYKNLDKV